MLNLNLGGETGLITLLYGVYVESCCHGIRLSHWSRKMEASRNKPGPRQYSKDTQDMLMLMMQESRLTNLQKRQITDCLQKGTSLPLPFASPSPAPPREPKPAHSRLSARPQRRSAEACRSGDGYAREKFCPGPTRDLEKEKRRLQTIMSTGQEEDTPVASNRDHKPDTEETDRFQEVLGEIEERRQFLADMVSLGQGQKYRNIINTEISQKVHELEMLDRRSSFKGAATSEGRRLTKEPMRSSGETDGSR